MSELKHHSDFARALVAVLSGAADAKAEAFVAEIMTGLKARVSAEVWGLVEPMFRELCTGAFTNGYLDGILDAISLVQKDNVE